MRLVCNDAQRRLWNDLDLKRIAAVAEPNLVGMTRQIGQRNFKSRGCSRIICREIDLQFRRRTNLGSDFDAVGFVRAKRLDAELPLFEPNRSDCVGLSFEHFQV